MSRNVILTCPGCATRFSTPLAQLAPGGRRVRCSQCRHVWFHAIPGARGVRVRADKTRSDTVTAAAAAAAALIPPRPAAQAPATAMAPAMVPAKVSATARPTVVSVPDDPFDPPAYDNGADAVAAPDTPARRRGGWASALLWLIAALLVCAILAYVLRDPLRGMVPRAAPLLDRYTGTVDRTAQGLVGLTNPRSPYELRDIHYDVKDRDGEKEILVEANLFNIGDSDVPAPKVRVRVVDAERAPLHASVIAPVDASETIPAGESTRYFVRFPAPPIDFEAVLLNVSDQE